MSRIVAFLEETGPDASGRWFSEVVQFGLGALERHHDYIQWLFPLKEPSAAVPGSPVLADDDVRAIKNSPLAQANMARASQRLAWFYDQTDHWLGAHDHNHPRITRIIKSLRLLVGDLAADGFRAQILAKAGGIRSSVNAETRRYWSEA